jgi:hypothetical protein
MLLTVKAAKHRQILANRSFPDRAPAAVPPIVEIRVYDFEIQGVTATTYPVFGIYFRSCIKQATIWGRNASARRTMMLALRFEKSLTMARQYRTAFSIIGDSTTFRGIRRSE